jgi:hypothetical protein
MVPPARRGIVGVGEAVVTEAKRARDAAVLRNFILKEWNL